MQCVQSFHQDSAGLRSTTLSQRKVSSLLTVVAIWKLSLQLTYITKDNDLETLVMATCICLETEPMTTIWSHVLHAERIKVDLDKKGFINKDPNRLKCCNYGCGHVSRDCPTFYQTQQETQHLEDSWQQAPPNGLSVCSLELQPRQT